MTQEVQVILTLEVDAEKSKNDIHNFIMELIRTHTFHSTTYQRMVFDISPEFEIKEESEIYNLQQMNKIEQARDKHNKLREILQEFGNEEYGDCIIDEITRLFDFPTTLDTDPDEEFKIEKAKQTLKEAGYFVDNLWHINDVKDKHDVKDIIAYKILNDSLTNENTMGIIFDNIDFYANERH